MAKKEKFQIWLAPLLLPLSWVFRAIAVLRQKFYAWGIAKSCKSALPCLCVGNISWGGTGKSPVIDYLLKFCEKRGVQSFVLTRGYGVKLPRYPFLLNKENYQKNAIALPDEPCMLLEKNPFAHIIIDPRRAEGAKFAETLADNKKKNILLMDDGFQHFALERNFNLILLDKDDLPANSKNNNWNKCIPLGSWREPKGALNRAAAFLLKCPHDEWQEIKADTKEKLAPFGKPFFVFEIKIQELMPVFEETPKSSAIKDYALLAGIGNPEQFRKSMKNFLKIPCTKTFFLADHAGKQELEKLKNELISLEIPLVCTEKDMVKIRQIKGLEHKEIYYTKTCIEFHDKLFAKQNFDEWLEQTVMTTL